jgi:outer membrane protein W
MHRTTWMAVLAVSAAVVAVSGGAAAQEDRWRLRVGPLAALATAEGDLEPSPGLGAALEYRFSPRLGLELGALATELEAETQVDLLFLGQIAFESTLRMTPVLAKLDLHLTPDSRIDFYVAPVAAYVRMSDLDVRVTARVEGEEETEEVSLATEDEWAWGAALGLDVPLGGGSSFLALSATYLRLPLELRDMDEEVEELLSIGDVDPLFLQVAYGLRF